MNEQQNVNNTPKPKKKRSFWWLKLLLILILFAAGVIAGIMLSSQAITNQIIEEFFPQYAVTEPVVTPAELVPAETEKPIEFKPSVTVSPKPTKAPVEIVSPEAQAKEEAAESPEPTEEVLDFAPVSPSPAPETEAPSSGAEYIGIDAALEAALKHAGFEKDEVIVYSVSREKDDGLVYYEVEFGFEGREYEYEVNAFTAVIESWKSERVNRDEPAVAAVTEQMQDLSNLVNVEQAKAAALAHAGYKESDTKGLTAKLELENNKLVYEIEFRAEGYEYDYKVDASTGMVIMLEKERS